MTMGEESGALFAALRDCERGAWVHSPIYCWMVDNYAAMARAVTGKKVRWEKLSAAAACDGLTTRDGRTPRGETLRKTWYRVRKAMAALHEKQADNSARQEAERAAARERKRQETESAAVLRERVEQVDRAAAWARERDADARTQSQIPANAQTSESSLSSTQTPKIGEVKRATKMLEAAPLYGSDALEPPPPPYIGPRPAGLPENVPLEALTSLDASGVKPDGTYDLHNLPGMPRRKFFRKEYEWAQACLPMIRAIPPDKRPLSLNVLFALLRSMPGMK